MGWKRETGTEQRAQRRLRHKFGTIHVSKPLEPDPEMPGGFRVASRRGLSYKKGVTP